MSKVLIVANGTATGDHIVARVREIMQADPSTRFELVLPRIPGSPEGSDTEQLRRRSADRCDRAVERSSS